MYASRITNIIYMLACKNVSFSFIAYSHYLIFAANASPNITVDKTFNVTVGKEHTLTVNTFDSDGDAVAVNLDSILPDGATFKDGEYKWTPTNMDLVNISYVLRISRHIFAKLVSHFPVSNDQ